MMMLRSQLRRPAFAASLVFAALALVPAALVSPVRAQTSMGAAFGPWRVEDKCTATANSRFPDHDAVSLKKRDDAIDACFKANGLPVRAHPSGEGPAQSNRVTPSE